MTIRNGWTKRIQELKDELLDKDDQIKELESVTLALKIANQGKDEIILSLMDDIETLKRGIIAHGIALNPVDSIGL